MDSIETETGEKKIPFKLNTCLVLTIMFVLISTPAASPTSPVLPLAQPASPQCNGETTSTSTFKFLFEILLKEFHELQLKKFMTLSSDAMVQKQFKQIMHTQNQINYKLCLLANPENPKLCDQENSISSGASASATSGQEQELSPQQQQAGSSSSAAASHTHMLTNSQSVAAASAFALTNDYQSGASSSASSSASASVASANSFADSNSKSQSVSSSTANVATTDHKSSSVSNSASASSAAASSQSFVGSKSQSASAAYAVATSDQKSSASSSTSTAASSSEHKSESAVFASSSAATSASHQSLTSSESKAAASASSLAIDSSHGFSGSSSASAMSSQSLTLTGSKSQAASSSSASSSTGIINNEQKYFSAISSSSTSAANANAGVLGRSRARIYFLHYGRAHEINYFGESTNARACTQLEDIAGVGQLTMDTMGTCVRLFTLSNCFGDSTAFYPRSGFEKGVFQLAPVFRSIGPCFQNEFESSTFISSPASGLTLAQKQTLTVNSRELLIPDTVHVGPQYELLGSESGVQASVFGGPLEPITHYKTGHKGRVEFLMATLERGCVRLPGEGAVVGANGLPKIVVSKATRNFFKQLDKREEDSPGFFIGLKFSPQKVFMTKNVFAQSAYNRLEMEKVESSIIDYLRDRSNNDMGMVHVRIGVEYDNPSTTRPKGFVYRISFPKHEVTYYVNNN